jgi:hypothetical protein
MRRINTSGRLLWWLGLALLLPAGCGDKLPPEADAGQAREALQTSLDAWKAGDSREALQARSPAIYFNEPLCRPGHKLLDYRLDESSEQRFGQAVRYTVVFSLKARDGATVRHTAVYEISIHPTVVIVPVRSDS